LADCLKNTGEHDSSSPREVLGLLAACLKKTGKRYTSVVRVLQNGATMIQAHAQLTHSQFIDADLSNSRFEDVNLCRATFNNVALTEATFRNVNLSYAIIEDANLEGMSINGIRVSELLRVYENSLNN
jgi:hypothetical protein